MAEEWKVGDEVVLKSGGPVMTVVLVQDEVIRCQWFHGERLEHGEFPAAALTTPPKKGPAMFVV